MYFDYSVLFEAIPFNVGLSHSHTSYLALKMKSRYTLMVRTETRAKKYVQYLLFS